MYERNQYKEMMSVLANMDAQTFVQVKNEEMSLLHHAAYDGNFEVVNSMTTLPYFKDVVNDDSNDVSHSWL